MISFKNDAGLVNSGLKAKLIQHFQLTDRI